MSAPRPVLGPTPADPAVNPVGEANTETEGQQARRDPQTEQGLYHMGILGVQRGLFLRQLRNGAMASHGGAAE